MLIPEIEERFTDLLAHIYCSIRWNKINTRHNAWDIWNHRVRAASTRGTLGEFVSRLCNHFGLQSLPEDAALLVEFLTPHQGALLDLTYREHIPVAMRAVTRAKAWKKDRFGAWASGQEEAIREHSEDSGNHRRTQPNPARRRREDRVDAGPTLFDALGPDGG